MRIATTWKEGKMQQAIMIRVKAADFDRWFREHAGQSEERLGYGITDGPMYRDAEDPSVVLVHLDVEDLDRATEWFKSEAFREAVKRAGTVERELWAAQKGSSPKAS